jgi:hypothetical protein
MSGIFLWGGIVILFAFPVFGMNAYIWKEIGAGALIIGWFLMVFNK